MNHTMNFYNHRLLFILIALLFVAPACSDFVDGLEEDPNNASDAPIEAVLNGAFTGTILAHSGEDARLACIWSRQFTGADRQYSAAQVYNVNAEYFEWDKYYLAVENAKIVIEKAEVTKDLLASGIAKVLKAHSLGMVASMWGDVPYREANRFFEIPNPVFDPQQQVYGDIQDLLDDAIDDLSGNPASPVIAGADFYFGGNPERWTQVAFTLKARFYMHTKEYASALSAAQKGVTDASNDWMIPHPTGSYNQDMNIYHSFGVFDREGYMTAEDAVLPSLLDSQSPDYRGNAKTDEDLRFQFLFVRNANNPTGWNLNYGATAMWAATAPFPLLTALETHLILAEAAWRADGNVNEALEHLNDARAILAVRFPAGKYEPYVLADFEAGGMAARPGETAADALLYEIVEEKYVCLVGQMEVFNDVRRTGNYLDLPPTTGNQLPARFLYPQVEIDANANTPSPIPGVFVPTPVNQ
jgi:starch-binding outer membrane protein, SusD/RagB family